MTKQLPLGSHSGVIGGISAGRNSRRTALGRSGLWLMLLAFLSVVQSRAVAQTYCTPQYSYAWDDCSGGYGLHLFGFTLAGSGGATLTDNDGSCYSSGYVDKQSSGLGIPVLIPGSTYTATVTVGTFYAQNFYAWIDFNDNGTFESSEQVASTGSYTGTFTANIGIPAGSAGGNHTMRVRTAYDGYAYNDPCSDLSYGSARDYTVQVGCIIPPGSVAVCMGSSASLTATGGTSYSWSPATGLSSTTGATVTATPTATTTYTITAATASCGTSTATATVTVNPLPTVNAGSDVTIATGSSTTLTASGTASFYTWSPAGSLSATTGASVVATPSTTTTYVVTGSTASSIVYSQAFVNYFDGGTSSVQGIAWTNFISQLVPTISYSGFRIYSTENPTGYTCTDATIAAGIAQALYTSGSFSGSSDGHTWYAGMCTGTDLSVDLACDCNATAAVRPYYSSGAWGGVNANTCSATAQTLSVEFYVSGATGGACSNTSSVTVTVAPPVSASASAGTICSGSSSTLTASGATTYSWAPATGLSATTGAVVTTTPSATTTYTVTGTTGTGSYSATVTVSVNPSPATIGGAAAICMGSATTLTNSVTGGSWSTADAGTATIDASSGVVTPVAVGNTTVTYTLPAGCYTTSSLVVNPLPEAITGTTDMCAGNTTSLTSTTTGGTWASANNAIVSVNTEGIVTSRNTAGITTISYTLPTGCYVTSTVNNMVAAISGSQGICSGLTATVADATTGGVWSSTNTTLAAIGTNGVITAGAGGGTATISYTSGGCYRTSPFTVSTTPGPITGIPSVCAGYTTTLYNASPGGAWSPSSSAISGITADGVVTGAATGNSVVSYRLSPTCYATIMFTVNPLPQGITGTARVCPGTTTTLGNLTTGGTWSSSNSSLASVNATTGVVSGFVVGSPSITYTAGGCYRTVVMTVNPNPPATTGATSLCAGSTSVLSNTATNGTGWSSSNTSVATVAGGTSATVSAVAVGNAVITFTTSTGCYATTPITVGTLGAISGTTKACIGASTTYTNATTGGVWSVSNTAIATIDPATGILTGLSQGAVTVTYTQGSCSRTLAVAVNAAPVTITGSQVMCVGTTSSLTSNGSTGTWASSSIAIASFPNVGNGTIKGMGAGTATVTYTAQATGCVVSAVVTVNPAITAITGTATACIGTSTTLANSLAGGAWSSSLPATASVDAATGAVTAVAQGAATIYYVISPNCWTSTTYTSKALPAAIAGNATLCTPMVSTLSETTSGGTWSSGNMSIATVGTGATAMYGVVTGTGSGTATISYTLASTGCSRTTVVTVNAGLNPGTISSSNGFTLHTVSNPTSVTLSSDGAAGGVWSSSNSSVVAVNSSTGLASAVGAGSATITYSVTGACTNTTTHTITVAAGRDANNAVVSNDVSISLYPNPTTGAFTVAASQEGTLCIYTVDGKEVARHNVSAGATSLSMPAGSASGIYMCRFNAADGTNVIFRLVLEN